LIFVYAIDAYTSPHLLKAIEDYEYDKWLIAVSGGYGSITRTPNEPVSGYGNQLDGKNSFYLGCSYGKWKGLYIEGRLSRRTMSIMEMPAPDSPWEDLLDLAIYSASIRFGGRLAPVGERIAAIGLGAHFGLGLGYQFIDHKKGPLMKEYERAWEAESTSKFTPSAIAVLNTGAEVAISSSISLTAEVEYVFSYSSWTLTIVSGQERASQRADFNASNLSLLFGVRVWFVR